jgi:GT2 family glycosyltransferase
VRWNLRALELLDTGATVVVPTLNRGNVLIDCLRDLLQQHRRPLEILVVDQSDGPSPEMQELAERRELPVFHPFRGAVCA